MPGKALMASALVALAGCAVHAEGPAVVLPQHVDVPKGHMPPPGKCRIWYPDRPPGQQPPPGECGELARRVPPGAVLVGR